MGYVFPYFEVKDNWIYRCEKGEDIICYRAKEQKGKTIVEVIKGNQSIVDNIIKETFDLNTNYEALLKDLDEDDTLMQAYRELGGYKLFSSRNPVEILASAVISQNATALQFRNMFETFVKKISKESESNIKLFPNKETIIVKLKENQNLGLGYRHKLLLEALENFKNEGVWGKIGTRKAIKELVKIRGIGVYTATSLLLFGYKKYDSPLWDRYIGKKVMKEYYGRSFDKFKEYDEYTCRKWGSARGLAIAILVAHHYKTRGKSLLDYWKINW